MTPEQTAAHRIANAVEQRTGMPRGAAQETGHDAVERISAAGLVIVPAGRIAELLDANNREVERRREARAALRLCLPHLVETVEALVQCHSTTFDWTHDEPLPPDCEPEALIEAEAMLSAIAAAKAALGEAPPA